MSMRVELDSVILANVTDFIITIVVFAINSEEFLILLPMKNTVFREKNELLAESTEGEERGMSA